MGILMGKAMQEQMEKNQEMMQKNGRIQMERQMQMQDHMMKQQMAISLARSRDLFQYWAAFYCVAAVMSMKGYSMKKNPVAIAPLIPLTFIVVYFGDLAHGNKMPRIRAEALRILDKEPHLLQLPSGLPSVDTIDKRRAAYSYAEDK